MTDFINYLNNNGYNVLIIANAAREGKIKPRNNDLLVCNEVYQQVNKKEMVRWYPNEMKAEEIREFISHTDVLVASRFHAMIGALVKNVPTFLIGWSHKYKEVLDMFNLGEYTIDFSELSVGELTERFESFIVNKEDIRSKISENIEAVIKSSLNNIAYISEIIDKVVLVPQKGALLDISNTDRYIGKHITCRMGYASDQSIRQNSSSGGMVTALLCHLIRTKQIDGAWVTKSIIVNGELGYKTFIATTEEEIKDCGTSIYMYIPLLKHFDELLQFNGRIAVVLLPCQMRALNNIIEKRPELKQKILLKIALYCSGVYSKSATLIPLNKKKVSLDNAERIYYRKGHWRGSTIVKYKDGSEKVCLMLKQFVRIKMLIFLLMNHVCYVRTNSEKLVILVLVTCGFEK